MASLGTASVKVGCVFPLKIISASRATSEGLVGGKSNGNKAALLILNCETEPVAKTNEF